MVHLVRPLCNAYPNPCPLPSEVVRTSVHPQFPQGYPQFCRPLPPKNRHTSRVIHNFHRLSTIILHSIGPCGKAVRTVRRYHFAACSCCTALFVIVYLYGFMNSLTIPHCPRRCKNRTNLASRLSKKHRDFHRMYTCPSYSGGILKHHHEGSNGK